MSIFKESKQEYEIPFKKRELHKYRVGFKWTSDDNWHYLTVCNASYDDIADELVKRLMLGFKHVTLKIMD